MMDNMWHKTKNIYYSMKIHMSKTNNLKIAKVSEKITVLGRQFQIDPTSKMKDKDKIASVNSEIQKFVNKICWFSYRRGFKTMVFEAEMDLSGEKTIFLNSDTGWGCMLRSGQMMMFQALQKMNPDTQPELILNLFSDNYLGERSKFSINNIVSTAKHHYNLNPGAWFRSTTIMMTCEKLNRLYPTQITRDLEIITFTDSVIILEKVYKRVFGYKFKAKCECKRYCDTTMCRNADATGEIIDKLCNEEWKTPLILNVASRLGLDKPSSNYEPCVRRMLGWENCIGVLGGYDYQAYYIIGCEDKGKYFYQDPHYTQEVKGGDEIEMDSYFANKTISEIHYNKQNCCLQFGFLIQGNKEFQAWWNQLQGLFKDFDADDVFISWAEFKHPPLDENDESGAILVE